MRDVSPSNQFQCIRRFKYGNFLHARKRATKYVRRVQSYGRGFFFGKKLNIRSVPFKQHRNLPSDYTRKNRICNHRCYVFLLGSNRH